MPEDQEHVVAAAEHAAEVLEHGSSKAQLPALLLAGAAFLASLGAFLKTFDHSTTEGTYKTTSDLIVKLNERQEKTDQQVAAIRGYLDGLTRTPMPVSLAPASSSEPAPMATHSAAHPSPPPHAPVPASTSASVAHADAGVITFVIPKEKLPPPMPPAAPVKPPPFDVARNAL
jgi:hypothetical protein